MRDFISQVFDSLSFASDDSSGSAQAIEVPAPSDADIKDLGGEASDEDDEGDEKDEESSDEKTDEEEVEGEAGDEDERVEERDEDKEEETDEEKADRLVKEKEEKKDDEVTDDRRVPSIKAIRKEYPDFFKKFPHVRAAIAEHQQFRGVFDSVEDAREAVEHQQNFMEISSSLFKGDFGTLLDEMQKAEPDSVPRLVKKILPTLLEKDRNLYMDVSEPAIKLFIKAAHDRGHSEGNKNLANAALHLAQFLTGKAEVPETDFRPDPRDAEFNKKISDFETAKLNDATQQVDSSIGTQLASLVEKAIDPQNVMKDLTKKALVRQVISDIVEETAKDEAHHQRMQRLWGNAKRSSYASGHISRIITASLERAKQVLPTYARKVREEHGIKTQADNGQRKPLVTRPIGGNTPAPKTIRETNPRKIDWAKTSDEDILSGKATLKR
jgi:hypothetical protein